MTDEGEVVLMGVALELGIEALAGIVLVREDVEGGVEPVGEVGEEGGFGGSEERGAGDAEGFVT